ncbi:hypothetical protein AURDEDRAFT_172760 [Auricularia subglabra TFB-10046 SS5]|nr:hypothetical protein AURDEDRAFT_172760 [Auricularia subglabra TFB-10046 SS5]
MVPRDAQGPGFSGWRSLGEGYASSQLPQQGLGTVPPPSNQQLSSTGAPRSSSTIAVSPQHLAMSQTPIPAFPTFGLNASWRARLWRTTIKESGGVHDPELRQELNELLGRLSDDMPISALVKVESALVDRLPPEAIPPAFHEQLFGGQTADFLRRDRPTHQPTPLFSAPGGQVLWMNAMPSPPRAISHPAASVLRHLSQDMSLAALAVAAMGDHDQMPRALSDWAAASSKQVVHAPSPRRTIDAHDFLCAQAGGHLDFDFGPGDYTMRGAGRSSPAILDVAGPFAAAETASAAWTQDASTADVLSAPAPTPAASVPAPPAPVPTAPAPAPARVASPLPQRARVPFTKDGKVRLRGQPAVVRSNYPDEDGERPPKPPLYALTPKGRLQAWQKRDPVVAAESEKAHEAARNFLCKTADRLGIPREDFLREGYPGAAVLPRDQWNVFQQFLAMDPEDWDVRAQYDFSNMTPKEAWEHFKESEADYAHIMRRFGYAFPKGTGICTLGQMDRYFWAVHDQLSDIRNHLDTCHGIQLLYLATNTQQFLEMFGICDLNIFTRTYQGHECCEHDEIAGLIGDPLPSGSINIDRQPKMTNPALYKDWDVRRIWCDVNTLLTERM